MSASSATLRAPARRTGLWVSGALLCLALYVLVFEYVVRTSSGQLLDTVTRLTAEHFEHPLPALNPENPWIPFYIIAPPAVLFLVIVLARQRYLAGLISFGTMAAANASTQLFKSVWWERPELGEFSSSWTQSYLDNSLPSGHTTMAAAAAVGMFLVGSPRKRPGLGLLSAVWAGGWGAYIFIEAWHRPSDMVAAYLVVAAWGLVGGWLIMRTDIRSNTVLYDAPPIAAPAAALCWFIGIVFTLAAGACFVFAGGWSGVAEGMDDPSLWHWMAGLLLSAGPAFLAAGAGIGFFNAEAGRRQRGAEPPSPRGERVLYPVPPEFRRLYDQV